MPEKKNCQSFTPADIVCYNTCVRMGKQGNSFSCPKKKGEHACENTKEGTGLSHHQR